MDKNIRDLLDETIEAELLNLKTLDSGSKEKETAINGVVNLYKLKIEETKNELDFDEKSSRRIVEGEQSRKELALKERQIDGEAKSRAIEEESKRVQVVEQNKDRYFRIGMDVVSLVLPLIFYGIWMNRGFKFEETGTLTSPTFRGLHSKFKPTKVS